MKVSLLRRLNVAGLSWIHPPKTSRMISTHQQHPLDGQTQSQLERYARYTPAPISIKHLLDHGKNSNTHGSFLFMKKEIPTRLANMIMELKLLPYDLRKQRECEQILNDYITSFKDLMKHEKETGTAKDLERFTETVNMIRRRHLDIVPKMA